MAKDCSEKFAQELASRFDMVVAPVASEALADREVQEQDAELTDYAGSGEQAQLGPIPVSPPLAERLAHALTHVPYAAWCRHCVAARGPARVHASVPHEGPPLVEFDYQFLKSGLEEDTIWQLLHELKVLVTHIPCA